MVQIVKNSLLVTTTTSSTTTTTTLDVKSPKNYDGSVLQIWILIIGCCFILSLFCFIMVKVFGKKLFYLKKRIILNSGEEL